ncbi:dTDP-glucose 4,6-dehydratase [Candidatus Azambacteria bacterium]|nr:dTDP-glucose 4,6-dehydratase [Candidatus Azambacteria bacterium]
MKILITGGAGFIGSNFVSYILKKYNDYEVVNIDKLTYAGNLDNLKEVEEKFGDRYKFIKGDICDNKIVDEVMEGVDVVAHFAAESHVDNSIKDPDIFLKTNILGTHNLLKSALKNKVKRFHHVSTDEVFGALELNGGKFNENTPYDPRSPYSASKAASDHIVRVYYHTYGLPITISNCSNNYGPYQFPEKIIPLFILNALEDKPVPVYGDGRSVRDYIFVEDHCGGIDTVIHKGKIGETYCMGGEAEKSGIEIADVILEALGKLKDLKQFVKDRPGHDRRYAIDNSKMKKEFGWKPEVSFEDGIKKTIKWYLSNEEWVKNLKK